MKNGLYLKFSACPMADWYYFPMTMSCYYVGGSSLLPIPIPFLGSWSDAQSQCQAMGAELASIHSPEENAFIVSEFFFHLLP